MLAQVDNNSNDQITNIIYIKDKQFIIKMLILKILLILFVNFYIFRLGPNLSIFYIQIISNLYFPGQKEIY